MWAGLFICVCIWLISLVSHKLFPIPLVSFFWAAIIGLIFPLAGLIWGFAKNFSPLETARWLDKEKGLKERLSTAIELSETNLSSPWDELVISDAARAVDKIETRSLLPLRLPGQCNWILLVLIACFVLGFVPEHRSKNYLDLQRDAMVIKDVGENLEILTNWQIKESPPNFEASTAVLDSVEALGKEFQNGKLIRKDALAKLSSISEKLRSEINNAPPVPSLRDKASFPKDGLPTSSPSDMQKRLSELEESFGTGKNISTEKFDALKSTLEAIKNAASDLSDADTDKGNQSRLDIAESLSKLSSTTKKLGLDIPNIEKALDALNSSNIDQFLSNINYSAQDLDKLAELSEAIENLQMDIDSIGKDLAEQLEKGQIFAALNRLEDMINQLESSQLTDLNLQEMIEELQLSLSPAENYGTCAQSLSNAKDSAKSGNKSAAAQSLADAKEELKNMLKQIADSQNLMQSLQNLERAQIAIGNCQAFSTTQRPGFSPDNNNPGAGVGTWGNDNLQLSPDQISDQWDNSGIQRPDTSPQGFSSRKNNTPNNLIPSRVKGQINSMGRMPSISLRGVSIKGDSKVQFQEAVSAAQSNARRALNQDKVPRAYRDSVRDYFDDLKN